MRRTGTAIGALLLALVAAETAFAQNDQLVPGEHWAHRTTPPVTNQPVIDVNYTIFGSFVGTDFEARIHDAAATWNANGASVNLTTGAAPTSILIIPVAPGSLPADLPPGAIPSSPAPTSHWVFSGGPGGFYPDGHPLTSISGAIIWVETAPSSGDPWNATPGPILGTELDFQAYMLHELGHALGLGDATLAFDSPGSVMLPSNLGLGPGLRTLDLDDLKALNHLYGSPEPATFVLFGLGLVAVGAARRYRNRPAKE